MNYRFPIIDHISQVLPLIKDRPEFIVAVRPEFGYTVINYVVQTQNTFPPVIVPHDTSLPVAEQVVASVQREFEMGVLRELRGLIFDNETGKVIARRYQKFFNVNEKEETQVGLIDFTKPHVILEKLDGSMITPIQVNGEIRWGTKMGVTDVAKPVEQFVNARPEYIDFALLMIEQNRTPIFEWCSRQQAIVIDYPEDMLVLTGIRHNTTGEYLSYQSMIEFGTAFDIPVVKAFEGTAANMQDLIDQTSPMVGCEGFVVRFDDGHMLKVKASDYLRKHKSKDIICREKNVVELIASEKIDDVKAFLDQKDLARVQAFEESFWEGVVSTANDLVTLRGMAARSGLDCDRRTYAVEFVQKQDEKYRPFLYKLAESKPTGEVVGILAWAIAASCGSQSKVDDVRWMFNCSWIPATVIDAD